MKASYINKNKGKNSSNAAKSLPERVSNLIEAVLSSYLKAIEGIEKPNLQSYLNDHMDTNDYDHIPGIEKKRTDFFLEMAFFKTKRIIRFMNYLTGVDQLSGAFREWLFKESLAESMVMFNATTYTPKMEKNDGTTEESVCWLDGIWRGKTAFYQCGMRWEMVEPMFEVWARLYKLKLNEDKRVCALLMVLILLSDSRHCPEDMKGELALLQDIHQQFLEALETYLRFKHKEKWSLVMGQVFDILTLLRDISAKSLAIQLAQLHKMECQMPSLLAKLFSYDQSMDCIGTSQ